MSPVYGSVIALAVGLYILHRAEKEYGHALHGLVWMLIGAAYIVAGLVMLFLVAVGSLP